MYEKKLARLRNKIDSIDRSLIEALSERNRVSEEIGSIKKKHSLPPLQKGRWREVLSDRVIRGAKLGLNKRFVKAVWSQIHKESIRIQRGKKK